MYKYFSFLLQDTSTLTQYILLENILLFFPLHVHDSFSYFTDKDFTLKTYDHPIKFKTLCIAFYR